jgi:hypothetical protein
MSNNKPDFEQCSLITRALLRKEANKDWVEFSHDGDCSFAGVYQPPLPNKNSADDEFILTSNYHDVWDFLRLPPRAKVIDIQDGARRICTMDLQTLTEYNSQLDMPVKDDDLYQFCFRATLTFEMLHAGYGFPLHYEIQSADIVNGQKLGWALGSTLYEINTLPWEFGGDYEIKANKHHATDSRKTLLGVNLPDNSDLPRHYMFVVVIAFTGVVAWVIKRHVNATHRSRQAYQSIA